MDWDKLAQNILNAVGGAGNVKDITHCATRLRLTLFDNSKADLNKIESFNGVLGAIQQGGQTQIIIGNDVPLLYDKFITLYKQGGTIGSSKSQSATANGKQKLGARIMDIISGTFTPIIPALAGSGLLKALLVICEMLGWISKTSQTYQILNFVGDSVFYFLPILLASSMSVKLKTNRYISMVIGAMLLHPSFVQMVSVATKTGNPIKLFGLPVTATTYSSSVVPIMLAIWALSYVEPFVNKIMPKVLRTVFSPLVILLIMTPLTLVVLAPIGAWLGDGLAWLITWLNSYAGWLISFIIGALSPLLVMTGMHYALVSIGINNLAKVGWENVVGPGMLVSNIAQGGAALAVATKTKDEKLKALGFSTGLSAVLGITEPALYGVNLRYRRPLISAMIGGGLGGLFFGIMGIKRYAQGMPGLLTIPNYIGHNFNNLWFVLIGVGIAFISSFLIQLLWGLPEEEKPKEDKISEKEAVVIDAPLSGEVEQLSDVNDVVFSQGMLGNGAAIFPSDGKIYAPFDAKVRVFNEESKHAIGLKGSNNVELLIHCGLDTVNLKGEGFRAHIKQGDEVNKGDLLLEMDTELIREKGYDPITMILVTNQDKFPTVNLEASGKIVKLQKFLLAE